MRKEQPSYEKKHMIGEWFNVLVHSLTSLMHAKQLGGMWLLIYPKQLTSTK